MTYFDLTWVIGNPPADELVANHQRTHTLANFERMHLRTNLCQILNQFQWHVPFSVSTWPQCLSESSVNQVKHILRNLSERKFKDISCYIINNNAYHDHIMYLRDFVDISFTLMELHLQVLYVQLPIANYNLISYVWYLTLKFDSS